MDIKTQPLISGVRSKMEFYVTILIFTVIGMGAIMMVELFLLFPFAGPGHQLPRFLMLLIFLAAPIPGFLFGLWFARKQLRKQFWRLTDTELSCGISRPQSFPLANIEKIIVGLPNDALGKIFQQAKPGTAAGATVDILSAADPRLNTMRGLYLARAQKENSLLICFKDGSWLPLRLFLLPNGRTIMDALRVQLKDRLIESHTYSAEEVRRLRRRDINELIPASQSSK